MGGAPYKVATKLFTNISKIAQELESKQHDIVGYGMVSHPYTCNQEKLWKAMNAVLRDPWRFGIKVDQVMVQDQPGFLKRYYRIISQNRVKVEHVRVNEAAQEFVIKTIKDGKESEVEHVWALATNPLRCELHSRKASDQMRVRWSLPHEQANENFDAVLDAKILLGLVFSRDNYNCSSCEDFHTKFWYWVVLAVVVAVMLFFCEQICICTF